MKNLKDAGEYVFISGVLSSLIFYEYVYAFLEGVRKIVNIRKIVGKYSEHLYGISKLARRNKQELEV